VQQCDDVLAFHTRTLETLRPRHKSPDGKAFLAARKRESESKGQRPLFQMMVMDKGSNAASNVVKQLHTASYKQVILS